MRALSTVADLLDRKGRHVHSIPEDASLTNCSSEMLKNRVSSLVVLDGAGKLAGLVTSRDLLRGTAAGAEELGCLKVTDVMTRDLRTTAEDADIDDVERMMISNHVRHLPVMKGDEIVGLITRIDVLRHYLDKQEAVSRDLESYITGVYSVH